MQSPRRCLSQPPGSRRNSFWRSGSWPARLPVKDELSTITHAHGRGRWSLPAPARDIRQGIGRLAGCAIPATDKLAWWWLRGGRSKLKLSSRTGISIWILPSMDAIGLDDWVQLKKKFAVSFNASSDSRNVSVVRARNCTPWNELASSLCRFRSSRSKFIKACRT
jgi:hypothetical protein